MMPDEETLIAAILASPNERLPRLIYADWLDEQGRPGGPFLRLECEIVEIEEQHFEIDELGEEDHDTDGFRSTSGFKWPLHLQLMIEYDDLHSNLMAQLRCQIRDLDEQWMSTVSRVPLEDILLRHRGIQSMLQHRAARVSLDGILMWETPPPPVALSKSLWKRLRDWVRKPVETVNRYEDAIHINDDWRDNLMEPGDEIWTYTSGPESWQHLCGEAGYALVRDGKVIEFEMTMMN